MNAEMLTAIRITGLIAILGALVYAVADVLLLAAKANLADYPNLLPHARLLSDAEKMVVLPWWRLAWGGLLGVFATPLILAGIWQVYQGMHLAGDGLSLPPALLMVCASVVGAFVHGSFIYLGEYVQALNQLDAASQPVLVGMFTRHKRIMIVTYGFLLGCILVASIWFSVLVGLGRTLFPLWMAAVNPVTALIAWMLVKRFLPRKVVDWTEGAGFNIAYLIFFAFTTATLWRGGVI
jgi:uncharacterized protein DUF6796